MYASMCELRMSYTKYDISCQSLCGITQHYDPLPYILFYLVLIYQQRLNWLFRHYRTLTSLLGKILHL